MILKPAQKRRGDFRALFRSLIIIAIGALTAISASAVNSFYFQRTRMEQIAPGVRYYHFLEPMGPANLDVLRVDRREKLIGFKTLIGDKLIGVEPVSRMVAAVDDRSGYPVGAVNGDFYHLGEWPGMTLGVTVMDQEIVSSPPLKDGKARRPCFLIYTNGKPDIAYLGYKGKLVIPGTPHYELLGVNRPRTSGGFMLYTHNFGDRTPQSEGAVDVIVANIIGLDKEKDWKLLPDRKYRAVVTGIKKGGGARIPRDGAVLSIVGGYNVPRDLRPGYNIWWRFDRVGVRHDVQSAVAGGPVIVENGVSKYGPGNDVRHPRTVLGYNEKEVYLVVVDGRRAGWSRGMSYYELGQLMVRMKCHEAINLDGGGSSTMWVRGELRNKVSDGRERPVSNGLAIMLKAPRTGRLQRIAIEPAELSVLTGYNVRFHAIGQDAYYNPVPIRGEPEWSADSDVGTIDENGVFVSGSTPASGRVRVRIAGLAEVVDVKVYDKPPIFQIFPTVANLFDDETLQFQVLAMDHGGLPVMGDYARVLDWDVTPSSMGRVDPSGLFVPNHTLAKGRVTVKYGDVVRSATVTVGAEKKLVDDFERFSAWRYKSHPENKIPGSLAITQRAAYKGKGGGELKYTFDDRYDVEAAYAYTGDMDLGAPMGVRIFVSGDGTEHQLRMAYRNRYDRRKTVAFDEGTLLDRKWHKTVARIDPDEYFPIRLESIYVLKEDDTSTKMSGTVYIDEITGLYAPE